MNRSQANRSVIAARAAANGRTGRHGAVLAPSTVVYATGPIRRSRAIPLTATQRNSEGRRSEWSASPEFFTDPKWSATCSTVG